MLLFVGVVNLLLLGVDMFDLIGWFDVVVEFVIVMLFDMCGCYWDVCVFDMWINVLWLLLSVVVCGFCGVG